MALEFTKLFKGTDVISQVGNFGFFKLSTESSGGGSGDVDQTPVVYGVKIDLANSNPETSVTYTDDAVGFNKSYMDFTNDTFEYGSWADKFPFNQVKPCILKDGVVTTYLNPNNYAEDVNGNPVDITLSCDGDVMIEIPKIYYYLHKDANYQYIQISNYKVDDNYCCLAHTYKGVEKDKAYIGAYPAYNDAGVMRSVSGVYRTTSVSLTDWRTRAEKKGVGYEVFYWNLLILLQSLYTIQFKNLNARSALGLSDIRTSIYLGSANNKGLYYGKNQNTQPVKFMGMEEFYGPKEQFIDGCQTNKYFDLEIADMTSPSAYYDSNGTGYKKIGNTGITSSGSGNLKAIAGGNETGFAPADRSGTDSTYYMSYISYNNYSIPDFGGLAGSPFLPSVFTLRFSNSAGSPASDATSRLTYCG